MTNIVSFDIFDTCLIRACGTPDCFWDILSLKVFDRECVDECMRQEFIISRKLAEIHAMQKKKAPSIYDIYDEFSFSGYLKNKDDLIHDEIMLETQLLTPVVSVKRMIDNYRTAGMKVVFISDMYIPGDILKPILSKHGLFLDGDKLYVSCDYGATKEDGSLFDLIKKNEGTSYTNWLHYGDNPKGDVASPKAKGIKAKRITHPYNYYPSKWISMHCPTHFNYKSMLGGLSRAMMNVEDPNGRTPFLLDMVAPLYCSFAYEVLKDAQLKGIECLYFCARDTYHLYNIAQQFSKEFSNIKIEYLYISRQSLKETSSKILLRLFEQEGLASKKRRNALVDCTTTGHTLTLINELLEKHGYNHLFGYYLIKWDAYSAPIPADWHRSFIRQLYADNILMKGLLRHIPVFECMMSANAQKRTVSYTTNQEGTIIPVFSDLDDTEGIFQPNLQSWENYYSHILQKYTELFKLMGLMKYSTEILNNVTFPTLMTFLNFPQKKYTSAFEGITVNKRNERKNIPYVLSGGLITVLKNQLRHPFWRRGTIVNNLPSWIGQLYVNCILIRNHEKTIRHLV